MSNRVGKGSGNTKGKVQMFGEQKR